MANKARFEVVDYRSEEPVGGVFPDQIAAEDFAEKHYKQAGLFWDDEHGLFEGSVKTLCVSDWDEGERTVTLAEIVEVPA